MAGMTRPVSRRTVLSGALGAIVALAGCGNGGGQAPDATRPAPASSSAGPTSGSSSAAPTTAGVPQSATPAQITARANVPVLCWHQLRDWEPSDESYARTLLICPPAHFRAQLDALAEGGWTTIGPDQYFAHLTTGAPLPVKPVLLTFDDSQGSQMTEAFPQLRARGMTATFFAMTVVLDKPGWLSARDLKTLDAAGMTVGAHTWDHHRVDEYAGKDWSVQLEQPKEHLEKIIGKPVQHLAYPFGAWNHAALTHVAAAGYRSAYQLADRQPDQADPLLTLRRTLVTSNLNGPQLLTQLAGS